MGSIFNAVQGPSRISEASGLGRDSNPDSNPGQLGDLSTPLRVNKVFKCFSHSQLHIQMKILHCILVMACHKSLLDILKLQHFEASAVLLSFK